jgi:phage shock protein A
MLCVSSHFKQLLNRLYGNIENLQSQVASLETQLTQEKAKNEQITCQLRQLEVDTGKFPRKVLALLLTTSFCRTKN